MKLHYLYILYSPQVDQYYTGISNYPEKRLHYHNSSHKGWTRRGRPWQLVFTKSFNSQSEAQHWETWIKNQKDRNIIEKIISKEFDWHI